MKYNVLTIAASDPSGGAGIEADLKVFTAHQVFGLTAITALTVQDTRSVRSVHGTEPEVFARVLETLRQDRPIAAIKVGALYSLTHLTIVSEFLAGLDPRPPVVMDPVIRSTSGAWLCNLDAVNRMPELIFPLVTVVTPNLPEAGVLAKRPVRNFEDMVEAAKIIAGLGPRAVLIKGGHLPADARDVLYESGAITDLPNDRLPREFHGTGCALSAAIAARLAQGHTITEAVTLARQYLRLAIQRARPGGGAAYILDFPGAGE
jgi:hydroxymethylpyrimidine/phosphomethylpyrimidine kinase